MKKSQILRILGGHIVSKNTLVSCIFGVRKL